MIKISSNGARRRYNKRWFAVLGVFAAVFLFTFLVGRSKVTNESVDAASLANFDPGYIISDYQMSDYNSMNEAEIQAFLTSKNSCPNRDYNYYLQLSAGSVAKWHFENGHFICLSEEKFGDGETIGTGETAAHIIWQTAQDFKINPKVILVLLQKETSLITDPIPNNYDYRKAVGYGCPDTAACSSTYYGFKNQVRNAAALFRTVLDGGWTNYPLGNNYIQYNPNAGCGGSVVNVRSLATSALYRYTPYQPNPGAIAAGYGTAPCGAYGNRNFYLYFQDWFGGVTDEMTKVPESDTIVDGEYFIWSSLGNNKVIDISGGVANAKSGTNIQSYGYNKTAAQKWTFSQNDDRSYSIFNNDTNKYLSVALDNKRDNGINVVLMDKSNDCRQKWSLRKNEDESITLYSYCSGKVLDISGASLSDGANIQIYTSNNSNAQKWSLRSVPTLQDGKYSITSFLSNELVLDSNNSNVQTGMYNSSSERGWDIKYVDGYYLISNVETGYLLTAASIEKKNGVNISVSSKVDNGCAQQWIITGQNDAGFVIKSSCSGLVVDVAGGSKNVGANIQLYEANKTNAQQWRLNRISDNGGILNDSNYAIVSALDNTKVLDISGGAEVARDGTNIQLYESNNTAAQKWSLEENSDGTYTIKNRASGKVIDVAGAGNTNGTNIQLYTQNGTCAQRWRVIKKDEYYVFLSACSSMAIDVASAGTRNGTNIQLYIDDGTLAQRWALRPTN